MSTTWRSIEKDPPKDGDSVWVASRCECWRLPYIWSETARFNSEHLGYTHWHPCEPPADLPPKPKTPFEEWHRNYASGCFIQDGVSRLPICYADRCTEYIRYESAEIIFNAGYEAGKAANGNV